MRLVLYSEHRRNTPGAIGDRNESIPLVEHGVALVMAPSYHVILMHRGQKLAEGATATVRAIPFVQSAYFGETRGEPCSS